MRIRFHSVIGLGVVAACLSMAPAALAQTAKCPVPPEPEIRLETKRPAPTISRQRSSAELQSQAPLEGHDATLGLYASRLQTSLRLAYRTQEAGGKACLWVSEAEITVAFLERTIHIARELQAGTCAYDVALDHERRHARTDDDVLNAELPRLKRALADAVNKVDVIGPIDPKALPAERESLARTLRQALDKAAARIEQARRSAQAQLDTPEAYRRDAARCPGGLRLR